MGDMTTWLVLPESVLRALPDARQAFATFQDTARTSIARAALLRLFDVETFDAILSSDDTVRLERLHALDGVELLPGGDGKYRVPDGLREAAWESWFAGQADGTVPPALRTFAEDVAAYCAKRGLVVDRLRALLVLGEDHAAPVLDVEFRACLDRLDLAGCRNLLDVLADPLLRPFFGKRLMARRDTLARMLAARELLRTAFIDPGRYLHRPALEARLDSLLDQRGRRDLRLQGSGGYGKTTLLKWFISRRCVENGVPCALVDLDVVDPVNVSRYPFLVALEIAFQLNGQLAGAPFEELLREHGTYRRLLTRKALALSPASTAALGTDAMSVNAEEVRDRFLAVTAELSADEPVVVVVDTFEEVALRPGDNAEELAGLLTELRAWPSVRLVLSGRRTQAEDGISALRRLTEMMPLCEVRPFTREESRQYLTSTRRIDRADLVAAIGARVGGVPWQLALYADVVERYPDITVTTLQGLDPGVAWAVDRIAGRVKGRPEDVVVQWLVRYGSVPRKLSRDFAETVLLPRITASMAGSDLDRPERDPVPPGAEPVFASGDATFGFDTVWDRLVSYAAKSSWVWVAMSGDDLAVEFDKPVRDAMRRLVTAQPIGDHLHRDAVAYYESAAAQDAMGWAAATAEAIYHHFWLDGARAAGHWYRAVDHALSTTGPMCVVVLAEDLLGEDYLDDGEPIELRSGRPAVDDELVVAAHTWRAWALAAVALAGNVPGEDAVWSRVETSLNAVADLPVTPEVRLRLAGARAALLIARRDPGTALRLLDGLADTGPGTGRPEEIAMLTRLRADALGAFGDLAGQRESLHTALRQAPEGESRARILEQLAVHELTVGHIDHAGQRVREAVDAGRRADSNVSLSATRIRIALASGRPATALRLATDLEPADEPGRFVVARISALTMLGRAVEAVELCSKALTDPGRGDDTELLTLRGLALADLFEVDRALADLQQARSRSTQLADSEQAGMACVRTAEVLLRTVGNLRETGHLLHETDRLSLRPGSPAWLRVALLRAELARHGGMTGLAEQSARQALDALEPATPPTEAVDIALAALSSAPGLEDRVFALLADQLPTIRPASARLAALGSLDRAPVAPWGARLSELVFDELSTTTPEDRADAAWLDLRAAHLCRIAGRSDTAVELARDATRVLSRQSFLPRWWYLDVVRRTEPRSAVRIQQLWEPDFPLLSAAAKLTSVELMTDRVPTDTVESTLDEAGRALGEGTQRQTRWRQQQYAQRARLAVRLGNESLRKYYQARADAVRVELGEQEQADLLDVSADQHRVRPEVRLGAEIDSTGALVLVADGSEVLRLPAEHSLVAALRRDTSRKAKSALVKWCRDAARRGTLLAVDHPLRDGQDRFDLRIFADPPLAQLPWELLTFQDRRVTELPGLRVAYRGQSALRGDQVRVRVLQEALTEAGDEFNPGPLDGYLGQETRHAITTLQYRCGLTVDGVAGPDTWNVLRERAVVRRAPRVVLLRREQETELSSARGYSHVGADDLAVVYRRSGWDVDDLRGAGLRSVDKLVAPGPVDVLHVNASMDAQDSMPLLDFGASWPGERTDNVAVSDLDHALYQLSLRGHTPLIVLDVAASARFTSESIREMLLRNDFAHQLLTLGKAHSVLATGLANAEHAAHAQQELVDALGAPRATVADVLDRLHRRQVEHLHRTVLFTALRPDLMPRVSPER